MNEFTKEELTLIIECIEECRFSKYYSPEISDLYNKIKIIISGWCPHEQLHVDYSEGISIVCNKCSKLVSKID